jgi:hypothetical protein
MDRRRFLAGLALAPAGLLVARSMSPAPSSASVAAEALPQTFLYRAYVPGAVREGYALDVRVSQASTWQGGTLKVVSNQGVGGSASVFGRTYPLMAEAEGGVGGFVGFGVLDPPGPAVIAVSLDLEDGSTRAFDFPIEVQATQWTVDHIILPPPDPDAPPPTQEELEEQARERQREVDLLAATYAGMTERKWDGRWIAPLEEVRITGYFGEQRSFNGGPVGGHHGGTDFGAWLGTPILATNSGRVAVAEWVITRGNMVIVDHGGGVFSGYAHMSEIDAEVGQDVAKGETVGKVGTTGLSTGYHLHWEMSVAGILVDGLRWLDGTQGF